MGTLICDPALSQVDAVIVWGPTNWKSGESVGFPPIIRLNSAKEFVSRL
jgi:hypothetical protein